MNFCIFASPPPKNFGTPWSQIFQAENQNWLWGIQKILRGKKQSFAPKIFKNNFVWGVLVKFQVYISNTVRGCNFPVNLFIFNKKLPKLLTGYSANFQNIFNRLSNRCPLRGCNCFWNYFNFFKKIAIDGGVTLNPHLLKA